MRIEKVKTESGFEAGIDLDRLNNMELVDALAELTKGKTLALSDVVTLILTAEDRKRLYDHVRNEDGVVPTSLVEKEIAEIFSLAGAKN